MLGQIMMVWLLKTQIEKSHTKIGWLNKFYREIGMITFCAVFITKTEALAESFMFS
uniref:Uncharacterized protein n=1 Tax=Proteus mirabilis TaxID=584 RepID=Q93LC8_PROMI|nr:unknown [Proteus mirabilis]